MNHSIDAMSMAYIIKGFWSKADAINLDPSTLKIGGELEVMERLIDYERHDTAAYIDTIKTDGFTGFVWAYEVSEPFGEWLAEYAKMHAKLPDAARADEYLRHLIEMAKE